MATTISYIALSKNARNLLWEAGESPDAFAVGCTTTADDWVVGFSSGGHYFVGDWMVVSVIVTTAMETPPKVIFDTDNESLSHLADSFPDDQEWDEITKGAKMLPIGVATLLPVIHSGTVMTLAAEGGESGSEIFFDKNSVEAFMDKLATNPSDFGDFKLKYTEVNGCHELKPFSPVLLAGVCGFGPSRWIGEGFDLVES